MYTFRYFVETLVKLLNGVELESNGRKCVIFNKT